MMSLKSEEAKKLMNVCRKMTRYEDLCVKNNTSIRVSIVILVSSTKIFITNKILKVPIDPIFVKKGIQHGHNFI